MNFSFSDHVSLLADVLGRLEIIVDNLDRRLLNVRGGEIGPGTSRDVFEDIINSCFFESAGASPEAVRLKGRLAAAHLADGFEPTPGDGYSRELNPVDLALRAHYYWNRGRWPGKNGRLAYAQSLYGAFVLRQLEYLSLRIWDEGNQTAAERLQQVQRLLDQLNGSVTAPRVRDARWLIQTAQGPLTRHLKPYFVIADQVAQTFAGADGLEIHNAGAVLAGGHMRSQLRHRSWQTGWAVDDPQLLAMTHLSNSMDLALLVGDLIPLLEAYSLACAQQGDVRLELADAILQGLSSDPELLLTRLDLLDPATLIEDLFVDQNGQPRYTETGATHLERVKRYGELVARTAEWLKNDALLLDPLHALYSPLGIVYGFCADLQANMVLNTLHSPSPADLSLEDIFISRGRLEQKRAQAEEWRRLPKAEGERDPFEHSTEWAQQMFARLFGALEARAARPAQPNASSYREARLFVVPRGVAVPSLREGALPAGIVSAQEHCLTSDVTRARDTGATALPRSRMANDRAEGRFLASADVDGAWFGVSKALLTIYISQGKDALITDVPSAVIDVLRLTCPDLLVVLS